MKRGSKPAGSLEYIEAKRRLERIRKLADKVGTSETAKQVGCSQGYVSLVRRGKRGHSLDVVTLNSLGLRMSRKLCRCCGEPAVIATLSGRCIVCELLELAKQSVIQIQPELSR